MLVGYFTEQPWQDPKSGLMGHASTDLSISNELYDPKVGAQLYNRYLDEKIYAEEMGFGAIMLNEHHSTPFCMQGVTNVGAAVLARQTKEAKIILLGNILPIWDDPLWLAEQLAMIDLISYGRLVSGFVRGGGRESVAHNAPPFYNRERFQEAHDFLIKAWSEPGPFRWEGQHYQYRYVNPWARPYQKPHPPIWIPSSIRVNTVIWSAQMKYPLCLLATELGPTKEAFELYRKTAEESGYESGTQHVAYLGKVHVDETEELAEKTARKYLSGVSNPFLAGNEGEVNPAVANLPGLNPRGSKQLSTAARAPLGRQTGGDPTSTWRTGGRATTSYTRPYEEQVSDYSIITGTPDTVIKKMRYVLEFLRPGSFVIWDGDGAMDHDDTMRSLRLFGSEVLPALNEIGKELELYSPWERDTQTGASVQAVAAAD